MSRESFFAEAAARTNIACITARESDVMAWVEYDAGRAIDAARLIDTRAAPGILSGRLVAVKDIIDALGFPTGCGSPIYTGSNPRQDASAVALIKGAGGIILGKTVTTEFAYFSPGKTTNPHNRLHTPGGSSSGSAAAVASGMVPIALGTQTAASITRPASYCGVVGFKPSYGSYSLTGIKGLAHSLDTLGVLARTVSEVVLMHAVLGRTPPISDRPEKAYVGLCRTPSWTRAQAETRRAIERAAGIMSDAGAEVREIELPPTFEALADIQATVMAYEAARNLAFEHIAHNKQLSPAIRELLDRGAGLDHEQYVKAQAEAARSRARCSDIFRSCDLILAPAAVGEAPVGLETTGDPIFSRMWSLLHLPSICLPGFVGPQGLPVGVQLLGAFDQDERLLRHALWVEAKLANVLSPEKRA